MAQAITATQLKAVARARSTSKLRAAHFLAQMAKKILADGSTRFSVEQFCPAQTLVNWPAWRGRNVVSQESENQLKARQKRQGGEHDGSGGSGCAYVCSGDPSAQSE